MHLAYPDITASGVDVRVVVEERAERNVGSRGDGVPLVAGHDKVDAGAVLASPSEAEWLSNCFMRSEIKDEKGVSSQSRNISPSARLLQVASICGLTEASWYLKIIARIVCAGSNSRKEQEVLTMTLLLLRRCCCKHRRVEQCSCRRRRGRRRWGDRLRRAKKPKLAVALDKA